MRRYDVLVVHPPCTQYACLVFTRYVGFWKTRPDLPEHDVLMVILVTDCLKQARTKSYRAPTSTHFSERRRLRASKRMSSETRRVVGAYSLLRAERVSSRGQNEHVTDVQSDCLKQASFLDVGDSDLKTGRSCGTRRCPVGRQGVDSVSRDRTRAASDVALSSARSSGS